MAHIKRRRSRDHAEDQNGPHTTESALSPVEAAILSVITDTLRRTGLGPVRSQILRATGAQALERHLTALQRKGAIVLGTRTHRSIRLVDPDEAAVIDPNGTGGPGQALTSETFTVDRMPGTLVRRLEAQADFFIQVSDRSFESVGVAPGELVAVREKAQIRTGSVVLAREGEGTVRCLNVSVIDDRQIVLIPATEAHPKASTRRAAPDRTTTSQIEGTLAGIVRARPIQHCIGCANVPKRDGEATNANEKPTPRQAAVLEVLRSHIRRTGVPASLQEAGRDLGGQTAGSVHKHVRELVRKGLVEQTSTGQRAYWPKDMVTVPIIEPQTGKTLAKSTIIDRAPGVLAREFDPRPDFFVAATPEIANQLALEATDLVAVQTITEPTTGEIVIARAGKRGHTMCGKLQWCSDGIAQLGPITDEDAAKPIVANTASDAIQIEGVVIGTVTFRSL